MTCNMIAIWIKNSTLSWPLHLGYLYKWDHLYFTFFNITSTELLRLRHSRPPMNCTVSQTSHFYWPEKCFAFFYFFQNLLKMKTFNIILTECQRQWFKFTILSSLSFHGKSAFKFLFLFILIHQIANLLVHLAEEVNITVCSWVDSFILHKQVLKPCFKLVSLSNNS